MICFLSLDSQCQASQCLQIYVLKNTSDHGHPLFIDSLLSSEEITNVRLSFQSHLLQQRALQLNSTATAVDPSLSWKTGTVELFSSVVCVICLPWNVLRWNAFSITWNSTYPFMFVKVSSSLEAFPHSSTQN